MKQLRQEGFTLLEVIIAMSLLAIIMVAALTPMLGLFGFGRTSENILDANTLAQQRLEEARAVVAANYATPADFSSKLTALDVSCKNIGLYGAELQANCDDSAGAPPLRRLSVTVRHNGQTLTSTVDVVNR